MKKSNQELTEKTKEMSSKESKLADRIASELSKPTRSMREVNLSRINRFTKENEFIVVPGKVLGGGELDHKVVISAMKFSGSALAKLEQSGSKIIPISEMVKGNAEGKKVRILG